MVDEPIRAAVYLDSEHARTLAEETLKPLGPDEGGHFSGVAEGWLEPSDVKRLDDAGLVVEVLGVGESAGEAAAADDSEPQAEIPGSPAQMLTENTDLIDEIKQQATAVSFADDGGRLVFGAEPAAQPDPRLHRFAAPEAASADKHAPEEDVYNIDIRGPITREQRLELDRRGVDIAAFEPNFGYRAFLTREQYEAVRKLPYVAGVTRYSFEQALAPELLDVVSEDTPEQSGDAQPELMSVGEEAESQPQVFDCLLHREQDLAKIRALIDRSPGTTILGTSNLRVRFSADVHLPFLAALAALPEVRKLSPYEAPKL
jgi:hypothetical protein